MERSEFYYDTIDDLREDPRDRGEALRPRLSRPLTYQHDRYPEYRDDREPIMHYNEPLPSILERRGLDYPPVRRITDMPFAPEPIRDSNRGRLNDILLQQERDRRDHIDHLRRPAGAAYTRGNRYVY